VTEHEQGDPGAVAFETLVFDEDLGAVAVAASPTSQDMPNLKKDTQVRRKKSG
jgi:hypothetical protein